MASTVLDVSLPELHNPRSGRLDAQRIAVFLDIPLTRLAPALGKNHPALYKTPDAPSVQKALRPIKASLDILQRMIGDRPIVLAWLNSPHPDLDMQTALDVILSGRADAVEHMLANAVMGIPS
jgi:hypothetical protein